MKLAIIGSRDFNDYDLLYNTVARHFNINNISLIISGGARGADKLGAKLAIQCKIPLKEHIPEWDIFGKSAGFKRNELIIEDSDVVLACWDGVSKGTRHSLGIAKRLKKPTFIIYF